MLGPRPTACEAGRWQRATSTAYLFLGSGVQGFGALASGRHVRGPETIPAMPVVETFSEFYRREHDGQVRRSYLLLGDLALAHDVVAEAFVSVFGRWETIREPGPYLNRVVVNGCRDAARRRAREPSVSEPEIAGVEVDPADYLADVLMDLPFRQRAAIVLRFYGGCSEAEIASHLRCRPGTVGSLIHRGLKVLRRQLERNL